MKTSIFVERVNQEEYQIKFQGNDWELNVHISHRELSQLGKIHSANWDNRTSIKAGISAGASVFWAFDDGSRLVSILVGHDDETWDFAITISANIIIDTISPYITFR